MIGRHAISWKLVERTARGPPGLCMPMWWPLLTLEKNFFLGVLNFFFFGVFSPITSLDTDCWERHISFVNPRGDHWAEFGPRDQCRSCARPKFGPIWYDVVEQFSFPSLVTDPGKKGVIGKLIHSSSCANFIQVQNAVSPNENPRYKTCGKVVPIFG